MAEFRPNMDDSTIEVNDALWEVNSQNKHVTFLDSNDLAGEDETFDNLENNPWGTTDRYVVPKTQSSNDSGLGNLHIVGNDDSVIPESPSLIRSCSKQAKGKYEEERDIDVNTQVHEGETLALQGTPIRGMERLGGNVVRGRPDSQGLSDRNTSGGWSRRYASPVRGLDAGPGYSNRPKMVYTGKGVRDSEWEEYGNVRPCKQSVSGEGEKGHLNYQAPLQGKQRESGSYPSYNPSFGIRNEMSSWGEVTKRDGESFYQGRSLGMDRERRNDLDQVDGRELGRRKEGYRFPVPDHKVEGHRSHAASATNIHRYQYCAPHNDEYYQGMNIRVNQDSNQWERPATSRFVDRPVAQSTPRRVGEDYRVREANRGRYDVPYCDSRYPIIDNRHTRYNEPQTQAVCRREIQRKEKEPDKFDGKGVEWNSFLAHFEQVASWNRWDEGEKAAQLSMSLRGMAQDLLGTLTLAQIGNYNTLKTVLEQRFSPRELEVAHRCQYRNRRRETGESAADFGYVVRRLAQKAYPNIPFNSLETQVIDQFVDGLSSLELRRHVILNKPNTLDRAIALATEYEAISGHDNKVHKPRDEGVYAVKVTAGQSSNDCQKPTMESNDDLRSWCLGAGKRRIWEAWCRAEKRCFNCEQIGHTKNQCPERQTVGQKAKSVGSGCQKSSKAKQSLNQ